ncbi:MAG: aminotransferase class I/II-fold pyridoxal phosphate-dependent enzyme [Gemmatimonadales bacterium]|nr:MAG: aminotransferase class I/II-fold pyridoxal phosphate-dependent enzyme [Gemmatimonadales bacterium]
MSDTASPDSPLSLPVPGDPAGPRHLPDRAVPTEGRAGRRFQPFHMERWQSRWEHEVEINLSESGVHPLSTRELLAMAREAGVVDDGEADRLLDLRHGYGQTNGTLELRERIAELYPTGSAEGILVTTGGAEANFATLWRLLDEHRSWAPLLPTYMQIPGLVPSLGGRVYPLKLDEERGWQPDLDKVEEAFRAGVRVLLVTNPVNPTGTTLDPGVVDGLVELARTHAAWIVADEVYAGAEAGGKERTPTLLGRLDRVVATNSLSKAWGLPGLRIGWAATTPDMAEDLWARKDYTTIAPASLSDALACIALHPRVRPLVLARTRRIVEANRSVVAEWAEAEGGRVRCGLPDAGAIALVRYDAEVPSAVLAEHLRARLDVLVVPGEQFGLEGALRIGFGVPKGLLEEGLDRVSEALDRVEAGRLG